MTGDDLLFNDLDGGRVGLDDVVADGLDRDYSARYDALRDLLARGTPAQRLHSCVLLGSWGVRDGFATIVDWAADPAGVPWAGLPVTADRFFGVDDAFGPAGPGPGHGQGLRVLVETRPGRATTVVTVHFPSS